MKKEFKFTEWVAKQIILEVLEYNFSDEMWYLQSEWTDNKINTFTAENLFALWKIKQSNK
jgi:hypothetical protein